MGTKIQIRPRGNCPGCGTVYRDISWKDDDGRRRRSGRGICPECNPSPAPRAWYLDFFDKGKRMKIYSDDTGQLIDSFPRAQYLSDKIKHQIEDGRFDPSQYSKAEAQRYWTSSLLDQFSQEKSKTIAPSYWAHYKCITETAKKFFSVMDIREIKKRDIKKYRNHLQEKMKIGAKTCKNYLTLFKTFLNWCRSEQELIQIIPNFPSIEVPEAKIPWLSSEDQQKILVHCPESDKPIIRFLMLNGCRPGEARALKVGDVDLRNNSILIRATFSGRIYREHRKGRGAEPTTNAIHPELMPYIEGRVKNNLPGAWLFVNKRTGEHYTENRLRRVWDTIKAGAKIEGLRLYDATRHSFVSQLLNAGVGIYQVQQMVGHRDIKTTLKYAHADLKMMRKNLELLSLDKVKEFPLTVHGLSTDEELAEIAK